MTIIIYQNEHITSMKSSKIIMSTLVLALLVATPAFAKDNGNKGDKNHGKPHVEQQMHVKVPPGLAKRMNPPAPTSTPAGRPGSNAFWNNWFNWFHRNNGNNPPAVNHPRGGHGDGDNDDDDKPVTSTTTPGTNLPPVISGITAPTALTTGQTGTWTVNASDPENGPLTYSVNWGDTAPHFWSFWGQQPVIVFVQTTTFTHSYANPGTYTITFTVRDDHNNVVTSTVTVNVTGTTVTDVTPPVLSSIVSAPGVSTSTITWTTNENATSKVYFGTTSPVNLSTAQSVGDGSLVSTHSVTLTGLNATTTYYFVVSSTDASNNVSTSSTLSFVTSAPAPVADVNPPVITNVVSAPGASTSTVSWTTDEPATSKVFFSTSTPVNTASSTFVFNGTLTTSHSLQISGLATSTLYHFVIQSADASNNTATASESTFLTTSGL